MRATGGVAGGFAAEDLGAATGNPCATAVPHDVAVIAGGDPPGASMVGRSGPEKEPAGAGRVAAHVHEEAAFPHAESMVEPEWCVDPDDDAEELEAGVGSRAGTEGEAESASDSGRSAPDPMPDR
jgi:hypothetical protein